MNDKPEDIQDYLKQPPDSVAPILADAVKAAELLLAYAAEQGSDLDEQLMQTIVRSKHTLATCALKESEESEFWIAYRKLCIATAPVSRESLEATNVKVRPSRFWSRDISEVGKAVFRYRVVAIASIFILLLFQVYWVFLSTLVNDSKRINNELLSVEDAAFEAEIKYEILQQKINLKNSDKVVNPQEQVTDPEVQKKLEFEKNPKYQDLLHQWNANLLLLKKTDVLSKAFKDSIDQTADDYKV
ncbi:MAG: hypothetical protein HYZ31_02775, partial [Gammaproteobacteria bacterium]|nr:hypothetical protein [Gammaproteobacteria bacterium]